MTGNGAGDGLRTRLRFWPIPNRWLVVALVIVMQAFTVGTFTYSFTFWVEPWTEAFGVGKAEVMAVASLRIYAVAAASFLLARYLDKLPQRLVATVGVLAYALSMLAVSAAPGLGAIFAAYVVFVPLALVLAGPIGAITFVTKAFDERRGFAVGIATMGTSLGGAIIPNVCVALLETGDWRRTHMILGLSSLAVLPLIWMILKRPTAPAKDAPAAAKIPDLTTPQILRSPTFWICVVTFMSAYAVFVSIQFNIAPYAADMGVGLKETALLVTVFTVSMLAGRLIVGYLSDKADKRYVFLGVSATIAAALAMFASHPQLIVLVAAFALAGVGSGGLVPLKGVLMADTFGVANVGRAMGVSAPFISLYGVAPTYAAWIRDVTGSYDAVFYTALALTAVSAPLILLVRPQKGAKAPPPPASAQTAPS